LYYFVCGVFRQQRNNRWIIPKGISQWLPSFVQSEHFHSSLYCWAHFMGYSFCFWSILVEFWPFCFRSIVAHFWPFFMGYSLTFGQFSHIFYFFHGLYFCSTSTHFHPCAFSPLLWHILDYFAWATALKWNQRYFFQKRLGFINFYP